MQVRVICAILTVVGKWLITTIRRSDPKNLPGKPISWIDRLEGAVDDLPALERSLVELTEKGGKKTAGK